MTGLVLCGGQSSRMGSDKGLLKTEAKTWALTAFDKLVTLDIPVVLSVNKEQRAGYAAAFPTTTFITDNSTLSLNGPLRGVLSAHLQYPGEDLFILACDMPLMEPFLLKELLTAYQLHPGHDAFLFTNNGEPEPLCGIYRSTGLATTLALYHSQQLARHSMKCMLELIHPFTIPLKPEQKTAFRNFNAHAELNGL